MDIGTAKVPLEERHGIPHHQLDVLDVTQEASVAAYQAARAGRHRGRAGARRPARRRGRVGALRAGRPRPARDPADRPRRPGRPRGAARRARGSRPCSPSCRAADPPAADAIEPNNGRRVVRALEVIALTGRPFSATMPTREFVRPDRARRPAHRPRRRSTPASTAGPAGCSTPGWSRRPAGSSRSACARDAPRAGRSATPRRSPSSTARPRVEDAVADTALRTRRLVRRQESWFGADPRISWFDPFAGLLGRPLVEEAGSSSSVRTATMVRMADRLTFTKGHGTENDFVLVPDLDGALGLTAARAAALADRRAGIGGDGVIRVVPGRCSPTTRTCAPRPARRAGSWTTATPTAACRRCAATAPGCSPRTCVARAWRRPTSSPSPPEPASSRCGATATGSPSTSGRGGSPTRETAERDGFDALVHLDDDGDPCSALRVDLGNPHTVVALPAAARPRRPSTSPTPRGCAPSPSTAPTSSWCARWARATSRCGCTSAASGRPGRAAPAPARPPSPTSFWAGCARHRGDLAGRRARWPAHRAAAARPRGRAGRPRGARRRRQRRPRAPAALTAACAAARRSTRHEDPTRRSRRPTVPGWGPHAPPAPSAPPAAGSLPALPQGSSPRSPARHPRRPPSPHRRRTAVDRRPSGTSCPRSPS